MAKETAAAAKDAKPTASHPPYFQMICEAISMLKDRKGSSKPAIAKFIDEKHGKMLPSNFRKLLSVQLKKFVKSERLVRLKNSYKLSSTEKLKLALRDPQKKKGSAQKQKLKAVPKKDVKTKRLSLVKTPEALKKAKRDGKKQQVVAPPR